MTTIETQNIKKTFGKKTAIENVSIEVKKGSIHAILGPNGSGKTTFVRMCTTLLKPDQGIIKIGGFDAVKEADQVRKIISLTGQNASIDEELTGIENLFLFSRLLGYSSAEASRKSKNLLGFFGLSGSGKLLVKNYSGGMRRKLDLATSMIKTPEILFLDEPTTGLDPRSRNDLWAIIKELSNKGTTILLTTQYMDEADQLAERITVLDQGQVISEGTNDELKSSVGGKILHITLDQKLNGIQNNQLETIFGRSTHFGDDHQKLTVPVENHGQAIELLKQINSQNFYIKSFHLAQPNLDEVFLALTGKMAEVNGKAEETGENNNLGIKERKHEILFDKHNSVGHAGIFVQNLMFAWRGLLKIKHIPEQFLDVLITPIMFTFMFTYLFGGAIAGSTQEYLHFLIPGILVQTLTFNAMYAGINIHTDISKGIFDRFHSMPIWLPAPLSGIFIGDFFRYLISGTVVLVFSLILGFRPEAGFFGITLSFLIMIAFALSISWLFIIFGLVLRSTSAVMSVGWLILMPVVFMSNIFADPATMPGWLQTFISYNPLAWQVDAVRGLLSGTPSWGEIMMAFIASLVISVILFPVAMFFYKKER